MELLERLERLQRMEPSEQLEQLEPSKCFERLDPLASRLAPHAYLAGQPNAGRIFKLVFTEISRTRAQ